MAARAPGRAASLLALLLAAAAGGALQGEAADLPAAPRPDLVPSALATRPGNLTDNATATLVATLLNQGNGSAPAVNVTFAVDGEPLARAHAPALDAYASAELEVAWNATEGNHTVRVAVDPEDEVNESDEANNVANFTLRVRPAPPPLPDLVVIDVGPRDPDVPVGENATFQARVLNTGAGPAANVTVRFEVDGDPLGNASVERLEAREGATLRSEGWRVRPGNHTVRAAVDPKDNVTEENEGNNVLAVRFRAAEGLFLGPDLRVSDVFVDPPNLTAGMDVAFVALIDNPGTEARENFTVLFLLDNATLKEVQLQGMGANGTAQVRAGWHAQAGEHVLDVQVDAEGRVNDSSRLNNALPLRFAVPRPDQRPDLVLDLLTAPAVIDVGDEVRLTAVVRNNGTWPSRATGVRFAVDGVVLDTAALPTLLPGQTASVASPPWTATPGNHVMLAKVDPQSLVAEDGERDNVLVRNLTVPRGLDANLTARADLVVAKLSWEPLAPAPGQGVVLRALVANRGNRTVGPFQVEFVVDGQVLDREPLAGLGTEPAVLLSRPWTAAPGTHTLGVRVDPTDQRRERQEGNNVAYAVLEVKAPGLFARPVPGPDAWLAAAAAACAASWRPSRQRPKR
jgi:subtilase family serine protease